MNKLTNEQKLEIEVLSKQGTKKKDIAEVFGINYSTVHYYLNKERRLQQIKDYYNRMPIEKRREVWRKKLPYIKAWRQKKYKEDEVFREQQKQRSKVNYAKRMGKKE